MRTSACNDEPTVLSVRKGSIAALTALRASRMASHFATNAISLASGMVGNSCKVWNNTLSSSPPPMMSHASSAVKHKIGEINKTKLRVM